MMVAWGAGYAAAHQKEDARIDHRALELISAVIGARCALRKEILARDALIFVINEEVAKKK
jgi:hypothetical protein